METIQINRKPYDWLKNSRKRNNWLWGSASSSKSHTIAQHLVFEKFCRLLDIGILVVRKTRPAVKDSCWPLIREYLDKGQIEYKPNLTELTITCSRGSFFKFDGLDNIAKKKSIEGINYIWIEELCGMSSDTRITKREYKLLSTICRHKPPKGYINQLFTSFNPEDPIGNKWVYLLTKAGDTDRTQLLHINYYENPFLSNEEYQNVEDQADEDVEYDKIYRKGEWATPTQIIYTNWDVVQDMPEEYERKIWGLDFGYVNPTALVELRFIGNEVYEKEWLYRTNLTNPEIIQHLKEIIDKDKYEEIIADSEDPKTITEIANAGFNVHPCYKGKNSVTEGIQAVKAYKCHLIADSVHLREEKEGYKWKQDRDKNPLPEPVKFRDHLMDAERYGIMKVKGGVRAGLMIEGDEEDDRDELFGEEGWTEY